MSAAAVVPLTPAEASRHDRFRAAELQLGKERQVTLDDMIDAALGERDRIEQSARAAEAAKGTPFDRGIVTRCVHLQKTAEFLGLVCQHKDEVRAVLQGKPALQRRARRA